MGDVAGGSHPVVARGCYSGTHISAIPVTQVFRTYTANKRYWKRGLLFVQFAGIAFMLTLLSIITIQYIC